MLHYPTADTLAGPGPGESRGLVAIAADALTLVCPLCATPPTVPCQVEDGRRSHLARFAEAARLGAISRPDMDAVLAAAGPVFTRRTLIPADAAGVIAWRRTGGNSCWCAEGPGGALLAVSCLAGAWRAAITWGTGPVEVTRFCDARFATRRQAQAWAEREAGAR